jgi:hypothetical protein
LVGTRLLLSQSCLSWLGLADRYRRKSNKDQYGGTSHPFLHLNRTNQLNLIQTTISSDFLGSSCERTTS